MASVGGDRALELVRRCRGLGNGVWIEQSNRQSVIIERIRCELKSNLVVGNGPIFGTKPIQLGQGTRRAFPQTGASEQGIIRFRGKNDEVFEGVHWQNKQPLDFAAIQGLLPSSQNGHIYGRSGSFH